MITLAASRDDALDFMDCAAAATIAILMLKRGLFGFAHDQFTWWEFRFRWSRRRYPKVRYLWRDNAPGGARELPIDILIQLFHLGHFTVSFVLHGAEAPKIKFSGY
jgi:hypothetical protein